MNIDIEHASNNIDDYIRKIASDAVRISGNTISEEKMMILFRSLARNESTLASNSTIAKDTGLENRNCLDARTVSKYIDLLKQLHIIEDTPAFDPSFRSPERVGLRCKRHLTDPSLAVTGGARPSLPALRARDGPRRERGPEHAPPSGWPATLARCIRRNRPHYGHG